MTRTEHSFWFSEREIFMRGEPTTQIRLNQHAKLVFARTRFGNEKARCPKQSPEKLNRFCPSGKSVSSDVSSHSFGASPHMSVVRTGSSWLAVGTTRLTQGRPERHSISRPMECTKVLLVDIIVQSWELPIEDCAMSNDKRKNHMRAMEFLRRLNAESRASESGLMRINRRPSPVVRYCLERGLAKIQRKQIGKRLSLTVLDTGLHARGQKIGRCPKPSVTAPSKGADG